MLLDIIEKQVPNIRLFVVQKTSWNESLELFRRRNCGMALHKVIIYEVNERL